MIDKLPQIGHTLFGFIWGAIVFWVVPSMIKEHKENRNVNRWWTKWDVKEKGESTRWK